MIDLACVFQSANKMEYRIKLGAIAKIKVPTFTENNKKKGAME